MSELNREQIIKALECCYVIGRCQDCPCNVDGIRQGTTCKDVGKSVLTLIKELTEELEKERTQTDSMIDNLRDDIRELTKKNEKSREYCNSLATTIEKQEQEVYSIKADTVQKMQELIAEHATNGYPRKVRLDVIDQIAKEMLEGE